MAIILAFLHHEDLAIGISSLPGLTRQWKEPKVEMQRYCLTITMVPIAVSRISNECLVSFIKIGLVRNAEGVNRAKE